MAKKSKKGQLDTLHGHVPHWVSYVVLIALFLLVIMFVRKAGGLGY